MARLSPAAHPRQLSAGHQTASGTDEHPQLASYPLLSAKAGTDVGGSHGPEAQGRRGKSWPLGTKLGTLPATEALLIPRPHQAKP